MKKIMLLSVLAALSFNVLATGSATFNGPTMTTTNGSSSKFFVDAANGHHFCEAYGFSQATGGTISCGEDEDEYATYDYDSGDWIMKNTGSKNQCYPLYQSISCN